MPPSYPIFICPNCRAGADLEADVDELAEEWQQLQEVQDKAEEQSASEPEAAPVAPVTSADTTTVEHSNAHENDAIDATVNITAASPKRTNLPHVVSEPMPIRSAASGAGRSNALRDGRTPSPPGMNGAEGPITPRNDAGPWVFDGSAGRRADASTGEMRSLDAAADMELGQIPSDDSSSR